MVQTNLSVSFIFIKKKKFLIKFQLSNGETISSLFDELFLIEYELKKAWCSGLHTVFFKEVVD